VFSDAIFPANYLTQNVTVQSHYRQAHWFAVPLDQRGANALTLGIRAGRGFSLS
jgi:hypothetical protein